MSGNTQRHFNEIGADAVSEDMELQMAKQRSLHGGGEDSDEVF